MFLVDGMAVDPLLETAAQRQSNSIFSGGLPGLKYSRPPRPPGFYLSNPFLRQTLAEPRQESELNTRIERAERFINQGEWEKARFEIEEALEEYPDNPHLLRRAAVLAALAGKYVAADEYFRRYNAVDPYNVTYITGWADVLIRLARYEEAWDLIRKAVEQEPGYMPARFDYTLLRILRNELEGVEKDWLSVPVESLPDLCSLIQLQQKDIEPLVGEDVFALLVDIVLGTGSLKHLTQISHLASKAVEHVRRAEWDQAEKTLVELAKYGLRTYQVQTRRSFCLYQMGKLREAAAILARLCRQYPQDGGLWYNLGFILAGMEKYAQGEVVFRKALELMPDYADARFALACMLAGQGKMDEAYQILEQLAETEPRKMPIWLHGDASYLVAIRSDPRFDSLRRRAAAAAQRKALTP